MTPKYAMTQTQVWHKVSEMKTDADGRKQVLGACGHLFLVAKTQDDEPQRRSICYGCLAATRGGTK